MQNLQPYGEGGTERPLDNFQDPTRTHAEAYHCEQEF